MNELNENLKEYIEHLIIRYPILSEIKQDIIAAYLLMETCYLQGHKLMVAGNGGSAADSDHIVGELMKSFKKPRPVSEDFAKKLIQLDSTRGKILAEKLECSLPAMSLASHQALTTAYMNDVDGVEGFAQQLYGYGHQGDVFLAISTSGNSQNIINAAMVAKACGIKVIGLTGKKGGQLADLADVCVRVPEMETYIIQELHLPVYHCWCLMLESKFFEEEF